MTPAVALRVAAATGPGPVHLVARPRGVLHVYAGPLTPGGGAPRRRRPVCNRPSRRLYAVEQPPVLAGDRDRRRLCRLCTQVLARRVHLGAGPALPHTAESVLWSVLAARDESDLARCRHALLTQVPGRDWDRPLDLPDLARRRYREDRVSAQRAIHLERQRLREEQLLDRLDAQVAEPAAS